MDKKGLASVLRNWIFYLILFVVILIIIGRATGVIKLNVEAIRNLLRFGG